MTSSLTTQDTGLNLEILKGQENYTRWKRDFKIVAGTKGVWKLYAGEETILQEPDLSQYVSPTPATTSGVVTRSASQKQEEGDAKVQSNLPDYQQMSFQIQRYKLDLVKYHRNAD